MPQAYDFLAEWFEELNDDCDYPKWSQYFIDGLARLGAGKRGLEVGCGSGKFSRVLSMSGYEMTGADISAPMLSKGAELAAKENVRVEFVRMDARRLKTAKKYDFILSPNDCYNYLAPEELPRAFRSASACLKAGGVFWFDVSSPCKLRQKVANTVMADDRDDLTYLSFNRLEGNAVETELTLFVRRKDGFYRRFDETHREYLHEEKDVAAALSEAGLRVLSVEGHLGENKEGSDRLNFICRK